MDPLLGAPGITRGISRDRFKSILRYLHLNDNTKMPSPGQPNLDKLYKVRPLFNKLKECSQKAYYPHQELAVDEAMVLFKGRSSIKQYMPLKPVKQGYKVWCICDSRNGYAYDFEVYLGAMGGSPESGLGEKVVQMLCRSIQGRSHHIYMDNFFTSPSLACSLHQKQTYLIGTARVNWRGFPEALRDLKTLGKTLPRGGHKSILVNDGKTECLVWIDKKPVAIINTLVHPHNTTHVMRTAKDGTRQQVPCPESIKLYNIHMGGVDLFDFRRKTYSCSKKSKKWWLRIFYLLLDLAVINAYVIYKETATKQFTQKEFTLQIASHNSRKRQPCFHDPASVTRLTERHFQERQNRRGHCRICLQCRRTYFCCSQCSPSDPIPLCPPPNPCFKLYHTLEQLTTKRRKANADE